MSRKLLVVAAVGLLAAILPGSPASAQATRTWVSGVGDDANPCSRTAPCKTWAGAISKTTAGGEIDALDPGGFGALTITKSITLDGGGGQVASVLVAGTNGINVAAGANDFITIRNIRFQGLLGNDSAPGNAGLNGISYTSGASLRIVNCTIDGFAQSGIAVSTSADTELDISNTTITNVKVSGISLANTGSKFNGTMDESEIEYSFATGITTSGTGAINFTVSRSVITGTITAVQATGSNSTVNVDSSTVTYNTTAFSATATGSTVRASNNNAYNNTTVFSATGGGVTQTAGNNRVGGSGGNITQQ